MTVYVVSGFPRSGTSAMMGALIASGMTGNYDRALDFLAVDGQRGLDYKPNPKGFFEGTPVPWYEADGQVTKRVFGALLDHDGPDDFKAIAMRRALHAINRSIQMWEPAQAPVQADFDRSLANVADRQPTARWIVVDYDQLVDDADTVCVHLTERGWPIVDAAAFLGWIDPNLRRN